MCTQYLEKKIMKQQWGLTEKGERSNETNGITEEGSDQQTCHISKSYAIS